jgi:molecular chaperone Hsp33
LAADDKVAAGMLLQKLPEQRETLDEDAWGRATQIAATLKAEELLNLPAQELIHRLYHEEDIRLFDAQAIVFQCACSRENVGRMLQMLGREEVASILVERGEIEVHCEFCNERYVFDVIDAEAVFVETAAVAASKTLH